MTLDISAIRETLRDLDPGQQNFVNKCIESFQVLSILINFASGDSADRSFPLCLDFRVVGYRRLILNPASDLYPVRAGRWLRF